MIIIIDYKSGNVASIKNAITKLGFKCKITSNKKEIQSASKVIFPGQGSANQAMQEFKKQGLVETIRNLKCPFLGICLGMQLLFRFSTEQNTKCLNIIEGSVEKFKSKKIKIPQMGWNSVFFLNNDPLFKNIDSGSDFYFANSYYVKINKHTLAQTNYENVISSVVKKDNFYGVQFHPEKSGKIGLKLLENFCNLEINNNFEIIPAIDLLDGDCVRLFQGKYDNQKIYNKNPQIIMKKFIKDGAKFLHIIDLNGAKEGKPINSSIILDMAKESNISIQVGGGIRTYKDAKMYLDYGIKRIILGSSFIDNQALVRNLISEFGTNRIVIAVDILNSKIAIRGWKLQTQIELSDYLITLNELGIKKILVTDINRDGTLTSPNFKLVNDIKNKFNFEIFYAGGVTSINDINKLKELGVSGVIIGKALYENKIILKDILIQNNDVLKKSMNTNIKKRIIACMDIMNNNVVKGTKYKNIKIIGNPIKIAKKYSDEGIDELVFLDISAGIESRTLLYSLITKIAKEINIPFTVGGGITRLKDVKKLLKSGADKISICSKAVLEPEFIKECSSEFGSQCISVSIDAYKSKNTWNVSVHGGRNKTNINAITFAKKMEDFGAGELLINSIDNDGTKNGFDIELLNKISSVVNIPVIASSGAGNKDHFLQVFTNTKIDAALAAGIFHSNKLKIYDLKKYLLKNNINIRNITN